MFHPGGNLTAEDVATMVAEQRFGARTRALLEDVRAFPEQAAPNRGARFRFALDAPPTTDPSRSRDLPSARKQQ